MLSYQSLAFLSLCYLISPAVCDLRIFDSTTKEIVFQTASDCVRTGCGSFLEHGRLKESFPLDACSVPAPPPNTDANWVVFAEDGGCDLKTKFRNAARAGYSGIIVGTDDRHDEIIHPGSIDEDDEEFIDAHLVHSLDIWVLSHLENLDNLVVEPPQLTRCKEEYKRTWMRSRYVSLVVRTCKAILETLCNLALWTLTFFSKLAKLLRFGVVSKDTYSSIALYLAAIVMSITLMMLISIHNNAKKLLKIKNVQQRRSSFESKPPPYRPQYTPSSPSPPQPPSKPVDTTLRHRINLNLSLNEPLTKSRVNMAYRDMALRYHPDKNIDRDQEELAKITQEFTSKKRSRDILLLFCKD